MHVPITKIRCLAALIGVACPLFIPVTGFAQERGSQAVPGSSRAEIAEPPRSALPAFTEEFGQVETVPSNYILGPDDQITLSVANLEEMSGKPMRIDMRGDVNVPIAGRIHAAGLTPDQLESEIESRLKGQLNDPRVIVSITDFRSQPVSILGAVNSPGVHQLEGRKTLFEMLSLAGGLRPDSGNTVRITRELKWGRIPLSTAHDDPTGRYTVASVTVKSIINGTDPAENIVIKPGDTITVPKADLIYVVGSVKKPGGYVLGQDESLSALQVLSLAEGLDHNAAGGKARIMRIVPGSPTRREIPINLSKLIAGKTPDLPLKSDDILFVPNSAAKNALARTAEAAISVGTSIAIYARP
jgi:polysaccharide export outer membrane protein